MGPPNAGLAAEIDANVPHAVVAQRQPQTLRTLELVVSNFHEEMSQTKDLHGNGSKWTLWVALRGFANEHIAKLIEKVVYELHPTFQQRFVTAYPPFFSLRRRG